MKARHGRAPIGGRLYKLLIHPLVPRPADQCYNGGDATHRGMRDRDMLILSFASSGRRRTMATALNLEDIGFDNFAAKGLS